MTWLASRLKKTINNMGLAHDVVDVEDTDTSMLFHYKHAGLLSLSLAHTFGEILEMW